MDALFFLGKSIVSNVLARIMAQYERVYILTGESTEVPLADNLKCYRFDNFHNNGAVEFKALELARETPRLAVFGVSEGDVLRVSALNDIIANGKLSFGNALAFRNKLLMKDKVAAANFNVPDYAPVSVPFDIICFIEAHGYPVVIKPVSGSGGSNTFILRDEQQLKRLFSSSLFDYKEISESYLIESFIEGDMYHIDGILVNGEIRLIHISCYRSSCLSYQEGKSIGSYMLDADHPLFEQLKSASEEVVGIFTFDDVSPFHLELFSTSENKLVFCEIACRAGGGPIMETLEAVTGYRLDDLALQGQSQPESFVQVLADLPKEHQVAGWILLPPQHGVLTAIPETLPFEWVKYYLPNAHQGQAFDKGQKAADNILQAVVTGAGYRQVREYLDELESWLTQHVSWQLNEDISNK
ncbi:ATP-grasp domain-containing protein [Vibrio sp. Of14-4]|uniref:ATP-grasp domain-containing protein n=1 Tax=Vibrio sp. Of14-4 TaxID=2724878 RepID=UPI001EF3D1BF|nr:ATP-grasp domain-containing protein [Vibrio sp. Of14-4]MCG7490558.1 ATP-grasp domain-containing protein [Vibrio sp. Of14-4]